MRASGETTPQMEKNLRFTYFILALIVILGLALRLWHLQFNLDIGTLDSMWYTDAAVKYSNGDWLTPSATYKGSLLTFLMSLSISLFNPTFMVTKFVPLFSGTLLPLITYLLGSQLFNRKVGLLSALIVSINPLLIFYSGLVFREILFSFTWTAFVYFALIGLKGKKFYSIIGGIFFALSSLTLELGIFAGIGIILYLLLDSILRSSPNHKIRYKNLDMLFFSAFLTLVPFVIKNYLAYNAPFISWDQHLAGLFQSLPLSSSNFMLIYLGLMAFSLPYTTWLKITRTRPPKLSKPDFVSSLLSTRPKRVKIAIITFLTLVVTLISAYEFSKGSGFIWQIIIGTIKLLEVLALPQSLGFLLLFSVIGIIFALKSSNDVALLISIFVFSAVGLTWGITSHYMYWIGLNSTEQLLSYYPSEPLDNAFRYVSSYIPLLSIFACYGIFLFSNKIVNKIALFFKMKTNKTRIVKALIVFIITLLFIVQFVHADNLLISSAQRDSYTLEARYAPAINWLSSQGSPLVYCFSSVFSEHYGQNNTILLTNESLNDIAQRATDEQVEYIVSDIFGAYSDAQRAFWFGGMNDDQSHVGLSRFELVKSYKSWPYTQIFKISTVNASQTALVVQYEDWGQEWVSFLSKHYLVETVKDENDLSIHFAEDYKLIVLTEIQRSLTDNELNTLQQKVASGAVLIVNGLSPAYMKLESNGDWIGGTNFVEAPKEVRLNIRFTQNALTISTEIDLNKSYALYSNSNYSSPTGLTEIGQDVVVYATRVEDEAAAIFAKPYFDGTIIFSGIRPSYGTLAKDYTSYIDFVETLIEKASDKRLFPN